MSIDDKKIIKKISVSPNVINPKTNKINDITDIMDLEVISIIEDNFNKEKEIQGTTELDGKKIIYRETIKEIYNDFRYTNLIGYEYSNKFYFFLSKDEIVSIDYVIHLVNKVDEIFDVNKISRIIAKSINLGDVNDIILSMK
ncbi:hypothetical protein GCM10022393_34380 [Aquimarina addita]|uniref:Uncharacterized protein n=1 Tax=Aquimarina addita TaxID=870485 RepID=A0ABP6UQL8_9FLAO